MSDHQSPTWAVAIFAARETIHTLERTLSAIIDAAHELTTVDVLVNGNAELAGNAARLVRAKFAVGAAPRTMVRVWSIRQGDKAHAFNQYVHSIWPGSRLTFFVDGYVRVDVDAFDLLAEALAPESEFLGASATPGTGRTARELRKNMLERGGLHGNLYALRESTMVALREMQYKLPLGLYRTDSTLGATLFYNLDPAQYNWEPHRRIFVHPRATWSVDEKNPWKFSDISGQAKRIVRQGQGILENLAVRDLYWVQKAPPNTLPRTAAELVLHWAASNPDHLKRLMLRHPLLVGFALRKLKTPRDWSLAETPPELLTP